MRLITQFATVFTFIVLALPAAAQANADPGAYNNAIVGEQIELLKKNLRYISKAAHSENERKIEARRLDVVEQNKLAIARVKRMPPCKGNTELRATSLAAFQTMLAVYSADYKQVNALAASRTQSYEAMERYYAAQDAANQKLDVVQDSANAAQRRFAKQFGMSLETSRESGRLTEYSRQVAAVNQYQHRVFLPVFRVQKANAALTEALNKQDAAAFGAARATLGAEAEKSAAELEKVPAYLAKDAGFRNAARDYANIFVLMSAKEMVEIAELLTRKDQFTKEDAQAINRNINTLNVQGQKYNEAYNRASSAFLDKYVPVMND